MKLNIAVLPGDGIGPEVMNEALKVTQAICHKFGHQLKTKEGIVGACAIDKLSDPYPLQTHQLCLESDAVLFGALGHPKYDNNPNMKIRPEQGLLRMRKELGLYGNIRPVMSFPSLIQKSPLKAEIVEGVDFVFIRELTGGIYFGEPQGRSEDGNTAYDTCIYTRKEIERILHLAYKFAKQRRKKVTVVDKSNIIATSRLWRQIAKEIASQYPDVETDYLLVDNAAMQIIQRPKTFDVLVTENMFGDILTDESAVITGSLGLLPSACIGEHTSLFEPIHGSYPEGAGKNIANPLAMILSVALMFEYAFKLKEEGQLIRDAVNASLEANIVTEDICDGEKAYATTEVGEWIVYWIQKQQ
ncbi:3-isopropylmalate dehydrogenase [Balneicella halophila]|uniref:3-isopropylmalate dehydrogenase n=1 Tax=Balneicella halophila TaxID=1537566 RepID=A0A7L4UT89_BALHA|nr:3-isopropylmalate dehydrogenase [Balneicella halophila]PVX52294.1 3-isopropylmalate dehydrogenase [Balneicella halophila]